MHRKIVLLARVSTLKREQDESPERQLEEGRAWAARSGWEVAAEIVERVSGSKGENDRAGLAEALRLVRTRKAGGIWCSRLDRLGRSLSHLLAVADELDRLGAVLVVNDLGGAPVDTSTAAGRLLFTVLGAIAEFIRKCYGEAAKRGQDRARDKGKTIHRPREVLPVEVAMVVGQFIGRAEMEGRAWTWYQVADHVEGAGLKMPARVIRSTGEVRASRPWDRATLRRAWERFKADNGQVPGMGVQKPVLKPGEEVAETLGLSALEK